MKKRGFLAPLAVSVAALLGSAGAASASIAAQPELELAIEAAKNQQAPGLVIERSQSAAPELAWHTSHQSHRSHASHQSHESHSSHYSGW
jgi:hypothetical protein